MNNRTDLGTAERQQAAARALDALGRSRGEHVLLRVRCGRGHHVAAVIATPAGVVFESRIGGHAHGRRDFVDEAHHLDKSGVR
ncbi:hypothetical protein [Nocardia sp. BMG111209]|uniref:hypothetical protein n=1 Tax=Nocardia sp. BMG111209 TaxID=1160137 RepID=UPI00039E1FB8|nr:hypothetical protein [Nocardia sp. BMG111209]